MKIPNISITTILKNFVSITQRREVFLIFLFFAALVGYLAHSINIFVNAEPSQMAVDEKLTTQKQLKIDPSGISVIESLTNREVSASSNLDETRTNPFETTPTQQP
jgi:hypothetical protein